MLKKIKKGLRKMTGKDKYEQEIEELTNSLNQLKLNQSQFVQAERMKIIDEFASGLAHEVKNPLAIILQGVDYLSGKVNTDDPNVALTIDYMKDAIRRADKVLGEFLDFSSMSALDAEPVDINSVIDHSLMMVHQQLETHHIEAVKEYGQELPQVKIDKNKLTQVFVHLILNAAQAMPQGGRVNVRTCQDEMEGPHHRQVAAVRVEIEDTGLGMADNDMARAFDFFFTTKRNKGNIGLGLSAVKTIMDMHGGSIKLGHREAGSGVKVTLMLKAER